MSLNWLWQPTVINDSTCTSCLITEFMKCTSVLFYSTWQTVNSGFIMITMTKIRSYRVLGSSTPWRNPTYIRSHVLEPMWWSLTRRQSLPSQSCGKCCRWIASCVPRFWLEQVCQVSLDLYTQNHSNCKDHPTSLLNPTQTSSVQTIPSHSSLKSVHHFSTPYSQANLLPTSHNFCSTKSCCKHQVKCKNKLKVR